MKQDYSFHRALCEIADHAILIEVVSSPRVRLRRFLYEDARAVSPRPGPSTRRLP